MDGVAHARMSSGVLAACQGCRPRRLRTFLQQQLIISSARWCFSVLVSYADAHLFTLALASDIARIRYASLGMLCKRASLRVPNVIVIFARLGLNLGSSCRGSEAASFSLTHAIRQHATLAKRRALSLSNNCAKYRIAMFAVTDHPLGSILGLV